jgi:hypothetical protein
LGQITGQTEWKYTPPASGADNPYTREHRQLIAAIRGGSPYNMGYDGATASMTGILGRMAAYEGREVTWEEATQSNECSYPERFTWDALPPTVPDKFGNYRIPFRGRRLSS